MKAVSSDIWDTILHFFLVWWVIWCSVLCCRAFCRCSFRIVAYLLILLSFKLLYLLFKQYYSFFKIIRTFLKHLQPLIACGHIISKCHIVIIKARYILLSYPWRDLLCFFEYFKVLISDILGLLETLDSILRLVLIIDHFKCFLVKFVNFGKDFLCSLLRLGWNRRKNRESSCSSRGIMGGLG